MRTEQYNKKVSTFSKPLCGFLWILSILILTLLDQGTKHLAKLYLKGSESILLIPHTLELTYVENRGIAFGMFQGRIKIFVVLCLLFFIFLYCAYRKMPKNRYYLPLLITGAVLGSGALGNFIDRIFYGYVIDFIYISLIDFPVFNVADIYVVSAGIVCVFLTAFYYQDEDLEIFNIKKGKNNG